jgi:tRNA dimethylallyltransferase
VAFVDPSQIPTVWIMGPTASGKSSLAMALAQHLPVEVVSVDSAQVYRCMNIGTAKPTLDERSQVPHHLIDILDPSEPYSAARFCTDAAQKIEEIRARGKLPLLVGGTMLYFRSLLHGLADLPAASAQFRAQIEAEAAQKGWPALHARLAKVDPQSAARLAPNDKQRIQRALEIYELSGVAASEAYRSSPRTSSLKAQPLRFALEFVDRAELHRRIEHRVHAMMEQGFLDEVKLLRARGDLHPDLPSIRSVGYRQLWRHLDGEWSLDEAVQRAIFASRQLAKRQLTWLRSETGHVRLDAASGQLVDAALAHLVR